MEKQDINKPGHGAGQTQRPQQGGRDAGLGQDKKGGNLGDKGRTGSNPQGGFGKGNIEEKR